MSDAAVPNNPAGRLPSRVHVVVRGEARGARAAYGGGDRIGGAVF